MGDRSLWKYILGFFTLLTLAIWLAVFYAPDARLHLVACDVGQGDAILIQRLQTQVLIDGGPGSKVLNCLGKYMPFWDRKIELVILTHPQDDHFEGLIEIFKRYKVENFLSPGIENSTQAYLLLRNAVGSGGTKTLIASRGMVIRAGLIQLDILNPTLELLTAKLSEKINNLSVVLLLKYGDFDALFTGDIGKEVSNSVAEQLAVNSGQSIDYLKVPHHGSRNGLTKELLEIVRPEVAVISVGKGNRYGHPNEEVNKLLNEEAIKILRTDETGDIEIFTDGKGWGIHSVF